MYSTQHVMKAAMHVIMYYRVNDMRCMGSCTLYGAYNRIFKLGWCTYDIVSDVEPHIELVLLVPKAASPQEHSASRVRNDCALHTRIGLNITIYPFRDCLSHTLLDGVFVYMRSTLSVCEVQLQNE